VLLTPCSARTTPAGLALGGCCVPGRLCCFLRPRRCDQGAAAVTQFLLSAWVNRPHPQGASLTASISPSGHALIRLPVSTC